MKLHKLVLTILLTAIIGLIPIFPNVDAATAEFEDDFETGNLTNWSGYRASNGETIGASSYRSYLGAYGGRATTNGGGGVEYAYTYQQFSSSELYVRGVFYVAQSGLVQNGDRFYLMALQSGSTTLASVGWRLVDGQVKWFLAVNNGGEWELSCSENSPVVNEWYSVLLYWKQDATAGESLLWIQEPYFGNIDSPICQLTGLNTAAYGGISEVRVGLPTVSYCGKTAVYFDNVETSCDSIWPVWAYAGFGVTHYSDNFETGNLKCWSEVKTSSGVAYTVQNPIETGSYSAKFATVNYGQAYCTKNIALIDNFDEGSRLFTATGCFYVSSCNINYFGRLYMFRAWDGNTEIIAAGIEKTFAGLRWFMERKDGAETVTVYSTNAPVLNKWADFTIYWNPFEYMWGVTCCDLEVGYTDGSGTETLNTPGQNTIVYNTITRLDFGIVKSVNCRSAAVYLDNVDINSREWE
ncbi:MAG: hypothetical protein ACFCUE_01735 [Candidatus Bathyarchaeia archaeon]